MEKADDNHEQLRTIDARNAFLLAESCLPSFRPGVGTPVADEGDEAVVSLCCHVPRSYRPAYFVMIRNCDYIGPRLVFDMFENVVYICAAYTPTGARPRALSGCRICMSGMPTP